jgi:PAS domain S-box-containing protein
MDITERKRAEGALRTSELNLRLILDSIPAPAALMTLSGQVESVNQPILEYFGRTFEELKRWGTSDAVHPDDLSPLRWCLPLVRRTRVSLARP